MEAALKELVELHPVAPKAAESQSKAESDSADDDPSSEKPKKEKKKGKKIVKKKKAHKKENNTEFLIYYDKFTVMPAKEVKDATGANEDTTN